MWHFTACYLIHPWVLLITSWVVSLLVIHLICFWGYHILWIISVMFCGSGSLSHHSNLANHLIIDTLWLWKLSITTWPLLSWGYQGAKFCNSLSSLSTEESLECNSDTIIQSQVKFRRIRTQFLTRLPSPQVPAASAGVPRPLTLLKSWLKIWGSPQPPMLNNLVEQLRTQESAILTIKFFL